MKSVYIHIPFCRNICAYCDFCKMLYLPALVDKYLVALNEEITTKYKNEKIKTLYIGGGTPSCLSLEQLEKLFKIVEKLNLSKESEITIEFNIEDITEEKLLLIKKYNVNRISIGIQTLNSKFFDLLGRTNNKKEIKNKIKLCKKYFKNINIDLMYGFNTQTINDLEEDLDFFLQLQIPHISIYSLILEKNTKLFINKYAPIEEDLEATMYMHIIKTLTKNGYNHYEISNFSLPGFESVHNKVYWENNQYYGFGLGASSYIDYKRMTNTRSITKYLKQDYNYYEETLTTNEIMDYQIILNLRLIDGINKTNFYNKFGKSVLECYNYSSLIDDGFIEENEQSIWIKEKYLYISNNIILKFIDSKNI